METSPLSSLDETIRKKIYTGTLTYPEPIPVRKQSVLRSWYDEKGSRLVRETWRFTPALLRTCTQIKREATPIFYASNAFTATIRNSDISELTAWLRETDAENLREVKAFVIAIQPTSFADLLDMCTGAPICRQARTLARAFAKTGVGKPKIELPPLTPIVMDASLLGFEVDDAEQMRSRWVLELGTAFEGLGEDDEVVMRMKGLMMFAIEEGTVNTGTLQFGNRIT